MTTDLEPLRAGLSSGLVALDFDARSHRIRPAPVTHARWPAPPSSSVAGGSLRAAPEPAGLDELRVSLPGLPASIGPELWLEDKGLSLVIRARLTAETRTCPGDTARSGR